MPTRATDAILEEDGAEAALADLAEKVRDAEEEIRALLERQPDVTWTIRDLQNRVVDAGGWSWSVVSIAFLRLVQAGVVRVGADLRVRTA